MRPIKEHRTRVLVRMSVLQNMDSGTPVVTYAEERDLAADLAQLVPRRAGTHRIGCGKQMIANQFASTVPDCGDILPRRERPYTVRKRNDQIRKKAGSGRRFFGIEN